MLVKASVTVDGQKYQATKDIQFPYKVGDKITPEALSLIRQAWTIQQQAKIRQQILEKLGKKTKKTSVVNAKTIDL